MIQRAEARELNRLYKELEELYHEIGLKIGLSDSAFSILYAVAVLGDGCRQSEICQEVWVSKQTINSSVRNLEKKGILYLKQGEGREKKLFLTEKGQKFAEEKIHPVIELENDIFSEMEETERVDYIRLSKKYLEYFRRREKKLVEEIL